MLVDCEVHLLHPEACDASFMADSSEPVVKAVHQHAEFQEIKHLLSIEALVQSMEHNSIQHAMIMGLSWHDSGVLRDNNAYIEALVRQFPAKFKGFFIPDPTNITQCIKAVELLDTNVFLGIKLLPAWQRVRIDDEALRPLLQAIEARELFLMVHTDHPTQSLDGDVMFRLLKVLKAFPRLKVLAPHMGGGLSQYFGLPPIRSLLQNVHFITSVSATMEMVYFAHYLGCEQILFGSDFPFNHCHDQSYQLQRLHALPLEEEARKAILGRRAQQLFRL
ncbi:MAG: amidohydrolase family protein [Bdellovibrionales bacterium]|nr:amidohydrolase family protein [Bdellovibrionales bacterium]